MQKNTNVPEPRIGNGEHRQNELLGGRYRVLSLLGRGGMGVVYKVEQIFLGKELALKTIDQASQSESAIRRFQAEARAVFTVNHPNIVSVHDFGLLDDQTPFLAMEFIQGQTIGERIQASPLPLEDALQIFIQVCFGLAHAHKNGVVHRDIKPNNIMILNGIPLGTEGSVKILDFGIAKLTQHDGGEIQALTKTGEIFGSPIYMSPEQCIGEKIDYRSDIYSLGCVIFEALTGTPPFVGESALSTMMMHQTGTIPTLKEASLGTNFSPELERLVHTMLSKNPNDRYQDLGIAAHDLAAIKSGELANFSLVEKPDRAIKTKAPSTFTMKRTHCILWVVGVAIVSTASTFLIMQSIFFGQQATTPITQPVKSTSRTTLTDLPQELAHDGFDKQRADKQIELKAKLVSDADFKALEGYTDAQEIIVIDKAEDEITNKGLSYLTSSKLLKLTIHGLIERIDNYAQLKNLAELSVSKSRISDAALANIAKMKMLHTLNLDECTGITYEGIRKLASSTSITCIVLTKDSKKYPPSFIDDFRRRMPQCRVVNFYEQPLIVTEHIKEKGFDGLLKKFERLQSITPDGAANAEILCNMAIFRNAEHKYAESRKFLDRAIKMLDKNQNENALPTPLCLAAETACKDHDDHAAIKYTDRLMQILPTTVMRNDRRLFDMFTGLLPYPQRLSDWNRVVEYCNVAIPIAERFPESARLMNMFEYYSQAGDAYLHLNKNTEAAKNYAKLKVLSKTDREKDFYWYATACVRLGKCLPTDEQQKQSYLEGIRLIEEKGITDTQNLLEHYCDACVNVSGIFLKEGLWEEAVDYNKKGLAIAERMMKSGVHIDAKYRRQAHVLDIINILRHNGRKEEARAMAKKYHFDMKI
ncbi:MAG: serine/threonine protein kinase [Cyanobacteria bacterium SZAS-4]|nr:serine/threonine protein kinase [Cyanobacteria bacterium SZAS-4]